jgi:hypothetical protein
VAEIDRLKEAEGIMESFAGSKMRRVIPTTETPLEERAYLLKLAESWALVDIAWSLRTLVLRTPVSK